MDGMRKLPSKRFWVVWALDGGSPTVRHDSRSSAEAEAERLAARTPDQAFVVLEAVTAKVKASVFTVNYGHSERDDVPF